MEECKVEGTTKAQDSGDTIDSSTQQDSNLESKSEIDYKAEYEKLIAQKERTTAVETFEGILKEQGYVTDDEKVKDMYEKMDNSTLQVVGDVLKVLKVDLTEKLRGEALKTGTTAITQNPKKPSFKDYINKK